MKLPKKPRKPRWIDRNHRAMLPADVRIKTLKSKILIISILVLSTFCNQNTELEPQKFT